MLSSALLLLTLTIWTAQAQQSNYPNQPYGDQQQYGNNRNQQYGNNQYGNSQNQYGNDRTNQPPYGNYGNNQPQFNNTSNQSPYYNVGNNSPPFGNNGNNQPPFGNNQQQFGNNGQFNSNNGQFNSNTGRFNPNTGQYENNNQFGNNNSNNQFGNPPFGNPSYGNNQQGDGNCCEDYCYVTDEDPYIYFGSKTAYDSLNIRQGSQHIVPDCTPAQLWVLVRQGTNLPKSGRITTLRNLMKLHDEISRNYEERRSFPDKGRLCPQDYDIFRRWRWNETVNESKGNALTTEGMEDLKQLARRYKSKFSQILNIPYDERAFYFQYTNLDRTHDSYQAFTEGLFGSESFKVHANMLNDDLLTRPDANCRVWNQDINQNNYNQQNNYMTRGEYEKFMEKPEYQQMVRDVFRRLGFRYTLNASIINDIYDLCRYEKAWYVQQRSAWCIAFTKNHLKLLEYAEDLKSYYKSGYGNRVSSRIGCGPIKDFYDRFERTVNGNNDGNKGNFHFTHSSTFQAFLTAMGIGKDYTTLNADNYYQQTRRNWRTSLLDPFTANLAAVLYQCRSNEKFRVLFLINEQPVDFPECSVGLCNWSTVQQKFEQLSKSCNVNDICNENAASGIHLSMTSFILPLIVYLRL